MTIDGKGLQMEEKLEKVRKHRLPGVAAILAAAALLLTAGGPGVTTVSSPLVNAAEPVLYKAAPAASAKNAPAAVSKTKALPEAEEEDDHIPCPVPESEAVEDTYFDNAIFLGDSRTQGLFLYSGLKTGYEYTSVGATVESVFTKKNFQVEGGKKVPILDAMAGQECDKVYIMLGVNELGWSKLKTYHDQYAKLIDRVREDHPEAKIALQSLPPVSAKQDAKKTYINNARIREYNEVIKTLAQEKDCYFLDVASCLTEKGVLPVKQTTDGVHFNTAGCKAWLNYLRTHSLEDSGSAAPAAKT